MLYLKESDETRQKIILKDKGKIQERNSNSYRQNPEAIKKETGKLTRFATEPTLKIPSAALCKSPPFEPLSFSLSPFHFCPDTKIALSLLSRKQKKIYYTLFNKTTNLI